MSFPELIIYVVTEVITSSRPSCCCVIDPYLEMQIGKKSNSSLTVKVMNCKEFEAHFRTNPNWKNH